MNITAKHPAKPASDRNGFTRKVGRHEGLPISSSNPAERFRRPYVVRLNIVRIGARALMSPNQSPTAAIRKQIAAARRGSLFAP